MVSEMLKDLTQKGAVSVRRGTIERKGGMEWEEVSLHHGNLWVSAQWDKTSLQDSRPAGAFWSCRNKKYPVKFLQTSCG